MMDFPVPESTAVIAVDLQTKLLPVINARDAVLERALLLMRGAGAFQCPVLATEQYPAGLGSSVPEAAELFSAPAVAKRTFSIFGEPAFTALLEKHAPESLIFCGVETHVCVLQSILDARRAGYRVFLASDATGSRKDSDKTSALDFLRSEGVPVLSAEALLFALLRDSRHPAFKTISKLVR